MKTQLLVVALSAALVTLAAPANAKGCVKGAAVGGVAGHVAGHHGLLGAAAGCVVGKHSAAKKDKAAAEQNANTTNTTTQPVKRTQS
jgi:uncharacterized protein YcfJ